MHESVELPVLLTSLFWCLGKTVDHAVDLVAGRLRSSPARVADLKTAKSLRDFQSSEIFAGQIADNVVAAFDAASLDRCVADLGPVSVVLQS